MPRNRIARINSRKTPTFPGQGREPIEQLVELLGSGGGRTTATDSRPQTKGGRPGARESQPANCGPRYTTGRTHPVAGRDGLRRGDRRGKLQSGPQGRRPQYGIAGAIPAKAQDVYTSKDAAQQTRLAEQLVLVVLILLARNGWYGSLVGFPPEGSEGRVRSFYARYAGRHRMQGMVP